MKKNFNKDRYLVVGNPIEHSLSPLLHNYWMKKNKIHAIYEKKKLANEDLKIIIEEIRNKEIKGINVTVPYKKNVIPYLDTLSDEAQETQSVNTIYLDNEKIVGHNTDIKGFEFAIKETKYDVANKKIFILGAGGVVPSIVFALYKMNVSEIIICNRTKSKAILLKEDLEGKVDLKEKHLIFEAGDLADALQVESAEMGASLVSTADSIDQTLQDVRGLLSKASEGPGTISRLLGDGALYEDLQDSVRRLESTMSSIQSLINAIEEEHNNFFNSIKNKTKPEVCFNSGLEALKVAFLILNDMKND